MGVSRLSNVRWKRVLLIGGAGSVLGLVALVGVGYAMTDVPEPNDSAVAGATIITYADGGEMGRVGSENRVPVDLAAVPEDVQRAVLAAEDRNHYTDPGISPRGIARALFTNVRGGGVEQGGSSITQQYAKNAFLSSERTYTRKVKEVFIALKMSRTVSKDEVLEDYLNTIYFGRQASGIEVAAKNYFGKSAKDLTVAEGAVLAASIRSPAAYDPEKHPERARERWGYVLNGMVEQGWLDRGERERMQYPRVLPASAALRNNDLSGPKGHIITKVMEELEARGFREDELSAGGLRVQSTIRRASQAAAEEAVREVVGDAEGLQGALVSVKPTTGEVWAYYGGATGTGFDYASQGNGRPAGSSFKPYVLAAALKEGIGLRSRFDGNSPKEFPGTKEPVRNFGRRDFGRVDLVEATEQSVNTAYYELGLEVGPTKVKEMAHAMGIPTSVPLASAGGNVEGGIALGIYDVHVIDQAVGFATFANRGVPVEPLFVKSVSRGDDVLYTARIRERPRALEEDVAADATYALRQVVEEGTGTRARLRSGQQAAGKTGTTSDNYDAWFVGFTPQLSTAVWIGTGQNQTIELEGVNEVTGGSVSAGIWRDYTSAALEGQELERFPPRADTGRTQGGGSSSDDEDEATTRPRRPRPEESDPGAASDDGEGSSAPTPAPTREPQESGQPQPPPTQQPAPPPPPQEQPPPPPAPAPAPPQQEPTQEPAPQQTAQSRPSGGASPSAGG